MKGISSSELQEKRGKKKTGLGNNRGLANWFKLYLTGCFPPKPPVRTVLTQGDDAKQQAIQQEYLGNQANSLVPVVP